MSTSICQSNLTSGFIDLATYDELEKYMYGGSDAIAYFVRETRKATWFTQVPVQLAKCEGLANFAIPVEVSQTDSMRASQLASEIFIWTPSWSEHASSGKGAFAHT